MKTATDQARAARLSALLQSWRSAHRRMRERRDPGAENLSRDIELEELVSDRPARREPPALGSGA